MGKGDGRRRRPLDERMSAFQGMTKCQREEAVDGEGGTSSSQEGERTEQVPDTPPPPLTPDQERRLGKGFCLADLSGYTYFDVRLQVVEAYYERLPSLHVVMRCWDPTSCPPIYQRPLRNHWRTPDYMDRVMIHPDPSVVEASRGKTVDIYCYDYDAHVGEDGRNFLSGDWLLFCNLKVGYMKNGNESMFAMHDGGGRFGRCIRRLPRNLNTEVNQPVEVEKVEEEIASLHLPSQSQSQPSIPHKPDDKISDQELPRRLSFREDEELIPRCKTIRPYVKWMRHIVPDDAIEDPLNERVQLLDRVYCNCGVPLTKEDDGCPSQRENEKRHHHFFRTTIFSPPSTEAEIESMLASMEGLGHCRPSASQSDEIPLRNEILSSLSSLAQRPVSATFDLVAQMSLLSVKRGKFEEGFPPCHISVWDGSIPPDSIGRARLLRYLTTEADKAAVGRAAQSDLLAQRTIDIRMATVKKIEAGEFVILRDVTIVRAYSLVESDGSQSPVWMLHAKAMDVIRTTPTCPQELAAFLAVAQRISSAILSEETEEEKAKRLAAKRKATAETQKRAKRICIKDTWMYELAEKDGVGMESQEDRTFDLKCTEGSIEAPTAEFTDLYQEHSKYAEFMKSLTEMDVPPKEVWLCWMKTCNSFNTIKWRMEQTTCCEGCDGVINQFAYIPVENPLNRDKFIHLLIDVAHFREGNARLSDNTWKKWNVKAKEEEMKRIVESINDSSIEVRRVTMMYLGTLLVFVVDGNADWATATKK